MSFPDYYLKENFFIKLIEFPSLYNVETDELYCLDQRALGFLKKVESNTLKNEDREKFSDLIKFCLGEGIITDKPVNRLHPKITQSPLPSLRYLELQITKRCNLRCKHCFVGEWGEVDLPIDKIDRILKDFEEMQGLRLLLTGGEPLLHPQFDKINNLLPKLAFRKILFTNGLILTEDWLNKLKVQEIQISLDGMKEGHESLRGKNTFDRTLSAIKRAITKGFDVSVATVIHKKNLHEFDKLEELIKNMGVREWTVDALTLSGNLKFNQDFWVEPEVAGKIMGKYGFTKEEHPKAEGYGCGAHLLAVLATGEAAFCSFFEATPIGTIDEGLKKLWKKKKFILLKDLECSQLKCPFINECFGGCRYRALTLSGKQNSKDLFKCYQFLKEK